jgi:hypothetical protein
MTLLASFIASLASLGLSKYLEGTLPGSPLGDIGKNHRHPEIHLSPV